MPAVRGTGNRASGGRRAGLRDRSRRAVAHTRTGPRTGGERHPRHAHRSVPRMPRMSTSSTKIATLCGPSQAATVFASPPAGPGIRVSRAGLGEPEPAAECATG
ncbi:hypothetical protein ACFPM0_19980 [Pseudonocardia sulfidoxydans]|uniref:hypothetical protein n=1 Tax=Pseudonocardia sulfidoxydans TaxID=54011 RepID=UPI003606FCB6